MARIFEIRHRESGKVIFEQEAESLKEAIEYAVRKGKDISGADLSAADLAGADLVGADFCKVNLSGADLTAAKLSEAEFFDTDLSGANLSRADLTSAYFSGTRLMRANFTGADLSGALLEDIDPSQTDLTAARGVHRCPGCGALQTRDVTKCPVCKFVRTGTTATTSVGPIEPASFFGSIRNGLAGVGFSTIVVFLGTILALAVVLLQLWGILKSD